MTPAKLRALIEAGTPGKWHFDFEQPGISRHIAAIVKQEDARLAEALVNLAPQLLTLWEAAAAVVNDPVWRPGILPLRDAIANLGGQPVGDQQDSEQTFTRYTLLAVSWHEDKHHGDFADCPQRFCVNARALLEGK